MSLLGSRATSNSETLGVVLDISNSTINIGIVLSKENQQFPELIWSFQELVTTPRKAADSESRISVSLLNVFMELENSGFVALRKRGITALPILLQVAITGPLAYTVTRTVSVAAKEPFKVTQKLFTALEEKAAIEAKKLCESQLLTKDLELEMLSNSTVSLSVNGYPTHFPFKSTATDVKLCQMITLSSKTLVSDLLKLKDKVLPRARIDIDSFMSIYFRAVQEMAPNTCEACFINSTLTGLELMVLRDSLPVSSTYAKIKLPSTDSKVSKKSIEDDLMQDLTTLFKNTGDGLSLPKRIYLHYFNSSEGALVPLLVTASQAATGVAHQLYSTTTEFFSSEKQVHNALACSAFVFHKKLYEDKYLAESLNVLKY